LAIRWRWPRPSAAANSRRYQAPFSRPGNVAFRCCLDGFVATSAVLPLARLAGGMLDHCRAGHVSAESGHRDLLRELALDPLLDLNMRLGEASALPLRSCCCARRLPAT